MTETITNNFLSEKELIAQIVHISATVWKHQLSQKHINSWLANFKGEVLSIQEEKIVALWLLTNFVYYNEDEVRHLCKVLYREFIHQHLLSKGTTEIDDPSFINDLFLKFKFYYLGKASESGGFILYLFRQINDIPLRYFLENFNPKTESAENIIFIDDVTLTADESSQAYIFFKDVKCAGQKTLLTLIATKDAIINLQSIGVNVIATIVLDETSKCFSSNCDIFHNRESFITVCKEMVEHYGSKIEPTRPLGYKDGQFAFAFFYNCPDNTLPIFWSENNGWSPIVKRYDKNYRPKYYEHETFI
jgi:hypothetical protein